MRHTRFVLSAAFVAVVGVAASGQMRIPGCTILTQADLNAAGIDFIMETSCSKELYQSSVMITDKGAGTVMVVISSGKDTRARSAYNTDVADYKSIGPKTLREDKQFSETGYVADLGDGDFVIGFLKGLYYFKYLGGGEHAAARKVSETIGRSLAKGFAARH